jgi:hypothetical protein
MALTRVRLNSQQAQDLSVLAALGPARLGSVVSALEKAERPLLPSAELRELITTALGEEDAARALLRQLVGFGIGIRRNAFSLDVVDSIDQALLEQRVPEDTILKWQEVKDIFGRLLADEHISLAVKAFDLSFDYANLFHGIRIITDCRPIFDDSHALVIGNIVRHILRLSYTSGDARAITLSLAIDRKEIEELRVWCDEALKKEAALARHLLDPRPTVKITPGDEHDELS